MISYRELREISLSFRRLSSNLLTSTFDNCNVQFERFKRYIDTTQFIAEVIQNYIKDIDFDYTLCFTSGWGGDMMRISIPADEACHIRAMYDYMTHISNSETSLFQYARQYSRSSKYDEIIQEFIEDAFKPLIDFINDAISKEMILIEEERKSSPPPLTQNIGAVYGTVNQGSGSITSVNTTNVGATDIIELVTKIISSLEKTSDIPPDEMDNVRDDLESITEQVTASSPKKNRLQKALSGIKKFFSDFSMKLAVGWAVDEVSSVDWASLIDKIEIFIQNLG